MSSSLGQQLGPTAAKSFDQGADTGIDTGAASGTVASSRSDDIAVRPGRVLSSFPAALPSDLLACTTFLNEPAPSRLERIAKHLGLSSWAFRFGAIRRAWKLRRQSSNYSALISRGDLEGFCLAFLLSFCRRRPVYVMYDCLWYGGGRLKTAWMRYCLRRTDMCVVWASIECRRYAAAYGVPEEKFVYVPHHHTLKDYRVEVGDDGYVFTGGNADRDFGLFFDAVRDLECRCVLATNRPHLLQGLQKPPNVEVVSVSPEEFRRLIARARIVVMPMRATLLHAGAQQTMLNAMMLAKPVVLTDPEGGADYIDDGQTGLLVPYGNPEALRRAIRSLLENCEWARRMGEQARQAAIPLTTEASNAAVWRHTLARVARRSNAGA